MIEHEASAGQVALSPREVFRANRIRIATHIGFDPNIITSWSADIYYDALEVMGADEGLAKLKG